MATIPQTRFPSDHREANERHRVTAEKVSQAVQQIVLAADPSLILAFGSWARGVSHETSDLDLAVVFDGPHERWSLGKLHGELSVPMSIDILVMTLDELSLRSLRLNSVHRDIVEDGVVLYRRSARSVPYASPMPGREGLLEVKFEEVNLMLKKASSDEEALNLADLSPQIAAFHGQQAVEKLLKAWLVALDVAPPRTHDLEELAKALKNAGHPVPVFHVGLKAFNDYAVKWRYADLPDPEQTDLMAMRETVSQLRTHIRAQISAALPGIQLFSRA